MKRLWFRAAKGLNVKYDPVRLLYNPDDGVQWLAVAYNIDLDGTGRVSRRKGYTDTVITDPVHSLWSAGGICLFVKGGKLCSLGNDFGYIELASVGTERRVGYTLVGQDVFWSNGVEKGVIRAGVSSDWLVPESVYGPESTRRYISPPAGSILGSYRGRIYVINGKVAWHTEPYGPNLVDPVRGFLPFGAEIEMFQPVEHGIYVGTSECVWFLRGESPLEFTWEVAYDNRAVFGSGCRIQLDRVFKELQGTGIMWVSPDGICLGLPDGRVMNLTRDTLVFEVGTRAAAGLLSDRYICTLPDTDEGVLTLIYNIPVGGCYQYLNYNFNSYANFAGRKLGAGDNGIKILDSGDKDGSSYIQAMFTLPPTDFGYAGTKSIRFLDVSFEANREIMIMPIADEINGHEIEVVPSDYRNRQITQKVPVGRYLRGRYFGLVVENIEGGDFSIDLITAELAGLLPASK